MAPTAATNPFSTPQRAHRAHQPTHPASSAPSTQSSQHGSRARASTPWAPVHRLQSHSPHHSTPRSPILSPARPLRAVRGSRVAQSRRDDREKLASLSRALQRGLDLAAQGRDVGIINRHLIQDGARDQQPGEDGFSGFTPRKRVGRLLFGPRANMESESLPFEDLPRPMVPLSFGDPSKKGTVEALVPYQPLPFEDLPVRKNVQASVPDRAPPTTSSYMIPSLLKGHVTSHPPLPTAFGDSSLPSFSSNKYPPKPKQALSLLSSADFLEVGGPARSGDWLAVKKQPVNLTSLPFIPFMRGVETLEGKKGSSLPWDEDGDEDERWDQVGGGDEDGDGDGDWDEGEWA